MPKYRVKKSYTDPKTGQQRNPGEEIELEEMQARDAVNRGEIEAIRR
jgi:hypothetical protein